MWTKLSDDFFRNQKVVKAGRDARDLYLVGLCHCNEHLTDGFIDAAYLRRLAADAEIDDARASASKLVEVGLWIEADGGYQVNDFEEYNISKAEAEAKAKANAERQDRFRKKSPATKSNALRNALPDALETPLPGPVPVPSVSLSEKHGRTARADEEGEDARPPVVPYTIEIENILAECDKHPDRAHFRAALDAKMAPLGSSVRHPNAMRRKILHAWLAGDGTPLPDPDPGSPPPNETDFQRRARLANEAIEAERQRIYAACDAYEAAHAEGQTLPAPANILRLPERISA